METFKSTFSFAFALSPDLLSGITLARRPLSAPNTLPAPAASFSLWRTAFSSTSLDRGVLGALRFPPARCGRGERVLWDEGDNGDGEWGWKFLNGDAGGPDAGFALTGEINTVDDELDELDEPDGTGSIEGFDFGFTMGDIEGFKRAPSSHLLFSSSSARRSPFIVSWSSSGVHQVAQELTSRRRRSSPSL